MCFLRRAALLVWVMLISTRMDYGFCKQPFVNIGSRRALVANSQNFFDVTSYGAVGDGTTDDTEAFQKAWEAACSNSNSGSSASSSVVNIPSGKTFMVGPMTMEGPCRSSSMVLQIDGTVVSVKPSKWGSASKLQWINISKLQGIVVQGSGTIDGNGDLWWSRSGDRPTALRFYGSSNVKVEGITVAKSGKAHVKMDSCSNVAVSSVTVNSPGDSPNTDGIHLQNTNNVNIESCSLACGDDCVSVQTGSSQVTITDVSCGPGHGISIGSLGQGGSTACVSDVTVSKCSIEDALNGVRIKTWQGGKGSVKRVIFSDISVSNVDVALNIDQYYCDGAGQCSNSSSAVAISGVKFESITGTYNKQALSFACSDSVPCTAITIADLHLQPAQDSSSSSSSSSDDSVICWNSYGSVQQPVQPSDAANCLRQESNSNDDSKSYDSSC